MNTKKKIRVLAAKPGLDGHDRGIKVVASALMDAGMEVIYTGLRQTPRQIVESAVQEDVDVIALSILSGSPRLSFPQGHGTPEGKGRRGHVGDRRRIIPDEDIPALRACGIAEIFARERTLRTSSGLSRQTSKHRAPSPHQGAGCMPQAGSSNTG